MAQNIEIKAYSTNLEKQTLIALGLSNARMQTLRQTDTFFNVQHGRLKLREFSEGCAQLIFYHRENQTGPGLSDYQITETTDAEGLKAVLRRAYGIRAEVQKTRKLCLCGRTRIHLDQVDNLGDFIELEVVLREGESIISAEREAESLMNSLGITSAQLIDVSYAELLTSPVHHSFSGNRD